jgi:hypothetical protein
MCRPTHALCSRSRDALAARLLHLPARRTPRLRHDAQSRTQLSSRGCFFSCARERQWRRRRRGGVEQHARVRRCSLGGLAGRHFTAAPAPKEGEVVVGFLLRCKVGGESGFCTPQGDGRALGREIDGTSDASLLAFAGWRCATATRSPFEPQRSADVCMCVLEPSCEAKSSRE